MQTTARPPSQMQLAAVSLVVGIALAIVAYVAISAPGRWFRSIPRIDFSSSDSALVRGQPMQRGDLWAPTAGADGVVIIRLSERPIDTASYKTMRIAALTDAPPIAVKLLWRHLGGGGSTSTKAIDWQGDGLERIALANDPEWRGSIAGLALAFKLQPNTAVLFRSATLLPDTGRSLLSQIGSEWFAREAWSMYSINYLNGSAPNPRVPMIPAIVAIAAIAFAVYRVLARRKAVAPSLAVGVAFAIVAWIVADARWQLNLLSNLRATEGQYAGKDIDQKHLAADDSNIYRLAEAIRRALPKGTTKVTLVSDLADSEFFLGKLRYYLFPLWLQPRPDTLDPRAVLAIVQPAHSVVAEAAETVTLANGRSLSVDTLAADPTLRVVRVR